MAKRLTDTAKWGNQWLRGLKAPYKLLWLYLLDECDHAGIWQIDMDVARVKIGEDVHLEKAVECFAGRAVLIDGGARLFLRDFVDFQYGELNPSNRVHASVIQFLKKFDLWDVATDTIKGHVSPLYGAMDKDKDKDKEKEKDKDKDTSVKKIAVEIVMPFESVEFTFAWDKWRTYRKQIGKAYKSSMSEQAQLKELSKYPEDVAIKAIYKSIASQWTGIFADKIVSDGNTKTIPGTGAGSATSANNFMAGFARRAANGANGGGQE